MTFLRAARSRKITASAANGDAETRAADWRSLYRAGGVAALLAGVLLRRNIAAEVSLFNPYGAPGTVEGWFALVRERPLLGLACLNFFDVIDYALLAVMFLAMYAALKNENRGAMTLSAAFGLLGAGIYSASNSALAMFSLSSQYAAADLAAQKAALLAAGQALLALNFTGSVYPGTGIYMSFLLMALATLLTSLVMLRGGAFGNVTAYIGLTASVLDLIYCVTFALLPGLTMYLMSASGLLLMIWHIMVGWKLMKLSCIMPGNFKCE